MLMPLLSKKKRENWLLINTWEQMITVGKSGKKIDIWPSRMEAVCEQGLFLILVSLQQWLAPWK